MMRRGRRLSTQILVSQLTILLVALVAGFALYAAAVRRELDHQYERRALSIAQAAAVMPQIRTAMARGDPDRVVARLAEELRASTRASYVVVLDRNGVRHSHPDSTLIGQRVAEPLIALDGAGHVGVDDGHLGRSANGKAPLRAPDGAVVGEVSAGILESQVSDQLWRTVPTLLLYTALALVIGIVTSLLLTRRLKRQTFGLELHEIAELLQEREAMLHGIREGVITLDPGGRISLVNDEARRLINLTRAGLGDRVDEVLPPGRLRDLLCGEVEAGQDEVVLTDSRCLTVTRMPVSRRGRPLGAVITLRDRTELVGLLRELDSVRNLSAALRAQQHEHANRMHTIAGLLDLDRPEEAASYLAEVSAASTGLAESLSDRIGDPTVVALLIAKVAIGAERGVTLEVTEDSRIERGAVDPQALITVLGNLIDNAMDAVVGHPRRQVVVRIREETDATVVTEVSDSGPGLPVGTASVFTDGVTTKPAREGVHRGLGLALVHRLVTAAGGTITAESSEGALFRVVLPVSRPAIRTPSRS